MPETPPTLSEQLAAVNAYADYLESDAVQRQGGQLPTGNRALRALRKTAVTILEVVSQWPEISRSDAHHLVLAAPDGRRVRYSYDFQTGAQRLTLVADEGIM